MTDKAKESKRAKDHWQSASKLKYEDVADRCMSDVWHRETMNENGFNLADVRRWEQNGNPDARFDFCVSLPEAIREERGVS